ncbi:MAG TPA: hypothetical protein VHM20_04585 [Gammaproteobacteria bacterium]|jgi:hypothetical protein|nr:hypothetical protein [Gammaproteobacteria bacterium]
MHILIQVEKFLDELLESFILVSEDLENHLPYLSINVAKDLLMNINTLIHTASQLLIEIDDVIDALGKVEKHDEVKLKNTFNSTHDINKALKIQLRLVTNHPVRNEMKEMPTPPQQTPAPTVTGNIPQVSQNNFTPRYR